MVFRYPMLVEAVVEFKRYVRVFIHEKQNDGSVYVESSRARETELAQGYR